MFILGYKLSDFHQTQISLRTLIISVGHKLLFECLLPKEPLCFGNFKNEVSQGPLARPQLLF